MAQDISLSLQAGPRVPQPMGKLGSEHSPSAGLAVKIAWSYTSLTCRAAKLSTWATLPYLLDGTDRLRTVSVFWRFDVIDNYLSASMLMSVRNE